MFCSSFRSLFFSPSLILNVPLGYYLSSLSTCGSFSLWTNLAFWRLVLLLISGNSLKSVLVVLPPSTPKGNFFFEEASIFDYSLVLESKFVCLFSSTFWFRCSNGSSFWILVFVRCLRTGFGLCACLCLRNYYLVILEFAFMSSWMVESLVGIASDSDAILKITPALGLKYA
mgnify:CR=1 FL=1